MKSKPFAAPENVVPWDDKVTAYDEKHFALYICLLDAAARNPSEDELCRTVFNEEPSEHVRAVLRSHLERARWMTIHGYKQLLSN